MFIPLFDFEERDRWEGIGSVPKLLTPVMTLIIIICVLVFIYQTFFVKNENKFYMEWGAVPYEIIKAREQNSFFGYINLITYAFLHGGFFHLLGNMWFFFIFGNNVEKRMGSLVFILFYLSSAVVSALIHMYVLYPQEMLGIEKISARSSGELMIPLVGASGAVSAVLGAYLKYFPRNYVATLVLFFIITVIPVSASIFIGVWLIGQIANAILNPSSNIAWFAHIGGFLYGYIFATVYKGRSSQQTNYYYN
ncbi:MAG: rhomboid family intramembrane serine protease [Brevinematales bacterium]|nr:rhomboid family intramembrane serine protease [Brevinematales bacterium]